MRGDGQGQLQVEEGWVGQLVLGGSDEQGQLQVDGGGDAMPGVGEWEHV